MAQADLRLLLDTQLVHVRRISVCVARNIAVCAEVVLIHLHRRGLLVTIFGAIGLPGRENPHRGQLPSAKMKRRKYF